MSAEVLREAARLMRERAEAATPSDGWRLSETNVRIEYQPHFTAIVHAGTAENAAHIASWHPAVALAVADFLDHDAELIEQTDKARANDPGIRPVASMRVDRALAVARAYLGDPS